MTTDATSTADLIFGRLFGDWVFGSGGTETTISHFLSLLSAAGLVLYGVIILYIGVAGMIRAAGRSGVLTGGWHPGWVPFRVLLSLMLVLPLYGGANWTASQSGLLAVARAGSEVADWAAGETVLRDLMERYENGSNFHVQVSLHAAQRFVFQGFYSAKCLETRERLANPQDLRPGDAGYERWFARQAEICGVPAAAARGDWWQPTTAAGGYRRLEAQGVPWAPSSDVIMGIIDEKVKEIVEAHNKEWLDYIISWRDYTNKENISDVAAEALKAYYNELQAKLDKALEEQYKQFAELYTNDVKKRGWMYIFTAQKDLARISQFTQSVVNEKIYKMAPEPEFRTAVSKNDQMINLEATWFLQAQQRAARRLADDLRDGDDEGLGEAVADALGITALLDARDGRIDPLVAVSKAGNALFGVGLASWLGAKAAGWVPAIPDVVSDALGGISIFILIIGALFLFISFLPLLFGASAILTWLVHIIEMLVAAPFWAAAHAAPDGENHTSRLAAKGYNNILFVVLFPILVVGGFFAALSVSNVMIPFLYDYIIMGIYHEPKDIIQVMQEPGKIIIFFGLLLIVSWIVIHGSYQLIETAPRAILGWLSDSAPGLNPFQQRGAAAAGGVGVVISRSARLPAPVRAARGPGGAPRGGARQEAGRNEP